MPDEAVEAGLSGDVVSPFAIGVAVSLKDKRGKVRSALVWSTIR